MDIQSSAIDIIEQAIRKQPNLTQDARKQAEKTWEQIRELLIQRWRTAA